MKRLTLLCLTLLAFIAVQAQWVNNPAQNTFIANSSADAGEIYTATNHTTGDTYLQWSSFVGGNGWSPTLQRVNFEGVPQWGDNGIHIAGHQFASSSEGFAMTTTTDGGVVSCFAVYDGFTYAVKINPDGTFPWGEQGVQLFGGLGFSRAEVIATDDGGIWALGFDYNNLYLQYINETTGPVVTISDNTGLKCMFGQLTLGTDNKVFVTYEKLGSGMYTNKSIYVAGYNPDGTQFSPETLLMSEQVFQSTYIHYAISDGMGGGYVYIWHPAMYNFNVYVFHFNENGASTIMDTNGTPVHSPDNNNLYISASATVDPDTHDIILVYEQTDDANQIQCKIYINRITSYGERVWGDGILVYDNGTSPCGGYNVDAFEYGGGFAITYFKSAGSGSMATVEAQGFDMDGNTLWNTQMSSTTYDKTSCRNSTGFHGGQNIIAWVNSTGSVTGGGPGGIYGQNIGQNGEMGEVTPPAPPAPCNSPTHFEGKYYFSEEMYGVELSWIAPEEVVPLHYNLYIEQAKEVIEIDPEYTSYFLELTPGDYIFRLTAVYDDCESDYALTPDNENYLLIEVTSVPETVDEEIVTVTKIYTMNGQLVKQNQLENLSRGVYIMQGMTASGKLVSRKVVVD